MKMVYLHACCGPCTSAVSEALAQYPDWTPLFYFFNPYIQPYLEFEKRRLAFKSYVEQTGQAFIIDESYDLDTLFMAEQSSQPRCFHCYRRRLDVVAQAAKQAGADGFSTTLLVSIYQDHDRIRSIGEEISEQYSLPFYYLDFRPYFNRHRYHAKQYHLYQQKYCGCIFSEFERYRAEKAKKGKIRDAESG